MKRFPIGLVCVCVCLCIRIIFINLLGFIDGCVKAQAIYLFNLFDIQIEGVSTPVPAGATWQREIFLLLLLLFFPLFFL